MSLASDGQFDIRQDEHQLERHKDCIDLLVAAGYFRARIKGLTAFDQIVGGIVWCISVCNYSIDVDLLYSENSTIGQKIALTEKIVDVLKQLNCPHNIEPHQIQGLDFIHIFPVVQWLVKLAIEAKKEHGDDLESYVDFLYTINSDQSLSYPTVGDELSQLDKDLQQAMFEEQMLNDQLSHEVFHQTQLMNELRELEIKMEKYDKLLASNSDSELCEFRDLLDEFDQISTREKEFKSTCRAKLAEMETELKTLSAFGEEKISTKGNALEKNKDSLNEEFMQMKSKERIFQSMECEHNENLQNILKKEGIYE
uniref:Coiled-coil domain-containing protein 93 n=1 Tax=Heterorhabditis bacteriophora TaxID=37862 RepID=A0A1I7WWA0_HETBA